MLIEQTRGRPPLWRPDHLPTPPVTVQPVGPFPVLGRVAADLWCATLTFNDAASQAPLAALVASHRAWSNPDRLDPVRFEAYLRARYVVRRVRGVEMVDGLRPKIDPTRTLS